MASGDVFKIKFTSVYFKLLLLYEPRHEQPGRAGADYIAM